MSLVTLIEHPLLDLRAADQPSPAEDLQVLPARWLAHPELVRDEQRAHPVPHQVTVALSRKMRPRITQPLQDQQPFLTSQRLHQFYVQAWIIIRHIVIMATS